MKTSVTFDTEDSQRSRVNIYLSTEIYETSFYYKVLTPGVRLRLSSEALAPSIFLFAMKHGGGQIDLPFPISSDFKRSFDLVVSIFLKWFPRQFSHVSIKFKESNIVVSSMSREQSGRVGLFFSGGLDSFCSLLRNRGHVTDLIYIHGLDIQLDDTTLRYQVSQRLRKIADDFNVNLIELATDIRHSLKKSTISWGSHAHGSVLASCAHFLDIPFEKVLIPSSDDCRNLSVPWGSHPLIDPLWSANGLKIVHDSIDMNRIDKGLYISGDEVAQQHLRVCYRNLNGLYNCGECRKCIKTMLILAASGSLNKFKTFEDYLDPKLLLNQSIDSFTTHVYPSVEVDQLVSLLRMQAEENVSEDCGKLALILERKVFLSRLKQSFPQLRLFVRKGFRIFLRSLSWVSYRRI